MLKLDQPSPKAPGARGVPPSWREVLSAALLLRTPDDAEREAAGLADWREDVDLTGEELQLSPELIEHIRRVRLPYIAEGLEL